MSKRMNLDIRNYLLYLILKYALMLLLKKIIWPGCTVEYHFLRNLKSGDEQMGTDDLFKKRRAARKQRRYEYKTPRANSFLIVTEGERTEPLYFQDFDMAINEGEKRGYQIAWSNQTCKTSHGRV